MADHVTVIGRSSFVRGRVSGTGSLEIAGRIEGEVTVTGDLSVEGTGLVAANLSARRITVRGGAIKGDLTAEDGIVLEAGSRIVGDLSAPRVSIAEGALVRGHVQTGQAQKSAGAAKKPAQAFQTRPSTQPSISVNKPSTSASSANGPVTARDPRMAAKAPPPPPAPPAKKSAPGSSNMPRGSVLAGTRPQAGKAPAPVVPVLKKGAKATQKKRA